MGAILIVGRVYDRHYLPSGHSTDKPRFATANAGGNRYRDPRLHYLPRVYINLDSRITCLGGIKMNESEWKSEIIELVKRMDRLECKWDALMRRLEGLERHPEDEGWFD